MLIVMRTLTRRAILCRTCGLAVYRQMTSATLVAGWWGPFSLFITPFIVLTNVLAPRVALKRLPEPYGAQRPPLDPGRRVLHRWPAMVILAPMALVVAGLATLILIGMFTDNDKPDDGSYGASGSAGTVAAHGLSEGDCVRNEAQWPDQDLLKVDCASSRAEYRVAAEPSCGPSDYLLRAEYLSPGAGKPGYCVQPL
jgi:hypothetical protein